MKFPLRYFSLCALMICLAFAGYGQSTTLNADSVKTALQGAWRMNADTNVVLVFYGDSMVHRMMRTSGTGRAKFKITDKNCDSTRFVKEKALYLVETYRYYQQKKAYDGKICNKIIYMRGMALILKCDGLLESYTKLKKVPPTR